jgi:hypothetical protein
VGYSLDIDAILERAVIRVFQSVVSQLNSSSYKSSNYLGKLMTFLLFNGFSSIRLDEFSFLMGTYFIYGSLMISFSASLFTFTCDIYESSFFLILFNIDWGTSLLALPDLS